MEISMNPYGTGACTISSDKYHKAYCCSAEHDWGVAIERLLSRPSFRVITSPYQLRVSDITEIKVFDGNRAMMVTIKTTDGEEKQVKAVCSSEDTFDLRKGVFIALAKYIAPDDSMTPEGYEFLAKCTTYYKDWSKLVDKAIRQYKKSCKEAEKKAKIQQEEKEKEVERRAKNFAKVQAKKQAKKDEFVQAVANAIRISFSKAKNTTGKEEGGNVSYHKKNRYKAGVRVLVKKWDDMVAEYGLDEDGDINTSPVFVRTMKEYCGKIMTISESSENGIYDLVEDETGWRWGNEMFNGAEQE